MRQTKQKKKEETERKKYVNLQYLKIDFVNTKTDI